MRNHIIFNSYLCQCPPSTHSWRKNRKDTIQIRTNNFSSTRLTHSFYKNHFKKNVQSEICQKTKNQEKKKSRTCLEHTGRTIYFSMLLLSKIQKIWITQCLTWNQSACKMLFFQHIPTGYGQYLHLHCTCTIHLRENYYHCLILSVSIRSLKVIRFPLLKFKNILKFQAQTATEKRMVLAQLENGCSNKNERVHL